MTRMAEDPKDESYYEHLQLMEDLKTLDRNEKDLFVKKEKTPFNKDFNNNEFQIKDSGERRGHTTGGVRDRSAGKGRYDLLFFHAIDRIAKVLEGGAIKYGDANFRKGLPLSWYADSGMRHLCKFLSGWTDEDHCAMSCWNLMALMETKKMIECGTLPKDLDDLPDWYGLKGNKSNA